MENIDYTDKSFVPHGNLHACWKENSRLRGETSHNSFDARRLENIAWRKWNKQMWVLPELAPSEINWNKHQDITWLYGPKYLAISYQREPKRGKAFSLTKENLDSVGSDLPDLVADDNSSETSEASMKSSVTETAFDGYDHLKSALKETGHPFKNGKKNRRKSVKFNYIVNSREIVNGYKFDYDILDASCL